MGKARRGFALPQKPRFLCPRGRRKKPERPNRQIAPDRQKQNGTPPALASSRWNFLPVRALHLRRRRATMTAGRRRAGYRRGIAAILPRGRKRVTLKRKISDYDRYLPPAIARLEKGLSIALRALTLASFAAGAASIVVVPGYIPFSLLATALAAASFHFFRRLLLPTHELQYTDGSARPLVLRRRFNYAALLGVALALALAVVLFIVIAAAWQEMQ